MATIFYARDGSGATRSNQGFYSPVSLIIELIGEYDMKYFSGPPAPFQTTERLSEFSAYRHVVVGIDADEISDKFPKSGYYYVHDLTPKECHDLFKPEASRE